ncbi:MAG: hypothetical protein M1820_010058 [Bogoriella megaspora]|nr:MAG: hypothetical protein M1820_010058 [Bogoriella megaspora]
MLMEVDFAPYASVRLNGFLGKQETLYPFSDNLEASYGPCPTDSKEQDNTLDVPNPKIPQLDTVVIGASWAGIWSLHKLQNLGFRVKLIDACGDVGGVWYYSRYPGRRVDTEVPFYEFSMPELWKKWN